MVRPKATAIIVRTAIAASIRVGIFTGPPKPARRKTGTPVKRKCRTGAIEGEERLPVIEKEELREVSGQPGTWAGPKAAFDAAAVRLLLED